jgi:hypothetical protein
MKNIHVLPTDKPSRLYLGDNGNFVFGMSQTAIQSRNDDFTNQNTHITSDLEIKEGDYCISKINNKIFKKEKKDIIDDLCNKIILTTDQDLIKDGVQAIDDEFLEWFVKNPSCEEIYVNKIESFDFETDKYVYNYKIIIPKEESKQYPIGGYAPGYYSCTCITCKKEFTGDKRAVQCEPCAIKITKREEPNGCIGNNGPDDSGLNEIRLDIPKQETLEEAAKRYYEDNIDESNIPREHYEWEIQDLMIGFAYQWQQEQDKNKYSELIDLLERLRPIYREDTDLHQKYEEKRVEIIKQFKNK